MKDEQFTQDWHNFDHCYCWFDNSWFIANKVGCYECQDTALEKLTETDHRDISIQIEEFNEELTSVLHYKVREE